MHKIPNYRKRIVNLKKILDSKSCFLFGPRQTGKTAYVENELLGCKVYSLLDSSVFLRLSQSPSLIREQLTSNDKIVVIDEIQKLPHLLDEVHLMIEKHKVNFLLTGSNARKLRNRGVNLLGGRARLRTLHPLVRNEISDFNLKKAINFGTIPSIYDSTSAIEDLESYVGTYLQQEIAQEGLARNIPSFSRFLEVAALSNGQIINYTNIASDAQVSRTTIQEYYAILQETLVGSELPCWSNTKKRKAISASKFFFFDVGVANFLRRVRNILPRSPLFGDAFESYIHHELKTFSDYYAPKTLHYWRSNGKFEVDFILNEELAIEVKAKENVGTKDLVGIRALKEEKLLKKYIVVSLEKTRRKTEDGITILPWTEFLDELWSGALTEN